MRDADYTKNASSPSNTIASCDTDKASAIYVGTLVAVTIFTPLKVIDKEMYSLSILHKQYFPFNVTDTAT